ncbi:SGNH/GDSL hydrolase family protein [uncultured Pontibacter sp.]|uniref:SGNH/GDSL hydrolase family protein n=1 Tax=uncultured Pontibacter sp. TaxID=453356 RepID=UPI0026043FB7|nr:SGNH/GDSL hydrolase family protein [uncultured Pontibacter sp.]
MPLRISFCVLSCFLLLFNSGFANAAVSPPQAVTAQASFVRAIVVKWQPVAGATSYTLEKSDTGEAGAFTTLTTVPGDQSSYKHTDLGFSQQVFYRVKATVDEQESGYSEVVNATTNPDDIIRLMPLGDSNTDGGSGSIAQGLRIGYRKELYRLLTEDASKQGYKIDFVGSEQSGQNHQDDFLQNNGYELDIDHAGFGGARDEDIALLLKNGEFNFYNTGDYRGPGGGPYLNKYNPDIILLHIGTNWVDGSENAMHDVMGILDQVDNYEAVAKKEVIVVIAKIIKRVCYDDEAGETQCPTPLEAENSLKYNAMLESYVNQRISTGDKLLLVDMQDGAGINYKYGTDGGDMADNLHPNQAGYNKMAPVWFDALMSPIVPLPVELIRFEAAKDSRGVQLEWVTASEKDNSRFEVERMQEGSAFKIIGAVAGAGNSNERITYTFKDTDLPEGILYYRLKQVDLDGSFSYSKMVAIHHTVAALPAVSLYPNLTDGSEAVQLYATGFADAASVTISLYNTMGKQLLKTTLQVQPQGTVDAAIQMPTKLPEGLYIVELNGNSYMQKLKLLVK